MERTELHCRRIDIRGFRRSDGLFEVEGRIIDTKPHDLDIPFGRKVPAETPLHNLGVRLVYDIDLFVHDVTTFTDAAPYAVCPGGGLALKAIIGLRMVSGWNQEVKNRIQKSHSCTHLVELLGPLATVAFQTISGLRPPQNAVDKNGKPLKIDSCYAYAADGEMVKERWSDFYEEKKQ
jgi:hypothetical protein